MAFWQKKFIQVLFVSKYVVDFHKFLLNVSKIFSITKICFNTPIKWSWLDIWLNISMSILTFYLLDISDSKKYELQYATIIYFLLSSTWITNYCFFNFCVVWYLQGYDCFCCFIKSRDFNFKVSLSLILLLLHCLYLNLYSLYLSLF